MHLILATITDAELKVFRYLYEAYSRDGIAAVLGLTRNTVDSHCRSIYEKMKVHSISELHNKCRELNITLEDLLPKPRLD